MSRDREDIRTNPRNRTSDKPKNSPTIERLSAASRGESNSDQRYGNTRNKVSARKPETDTSARQVNEGASGAAPEAVNASGIFDQPCEDSSAQRTDSFAPSITQHSHSKDSAFSTESRRSENINNSSQSSQRHGIQRDKDKYASRFRQEAQAEDTDARPSKLQFSDDELPENDACERKLEKARARSARLEERLHKAERKLPSRRKPRVEISADPNTGKAKKKLRFEKKIKEKSAALNGPAALRPVKGAVGIAGGYIHKKIYQNENENVGVQAAHRAELAGEAGLRKVNRARKLAPYNKVKRLQRRTINAQAKAAYQKALAENPTLKKKTLAKLMYKKRLKRRYAKAAREAQKNGRRAKKAAVTTEKIVQKIGAFVMRHPIAFLIIALILLLIFFISSSFASCTSIGAGSAGVISASSYLADDNTISQAELKYTEWETDLRIKINNIEQTHRGYDEYRYQLGTIGHDPFVLMGYLTAVYGEFDSSQAESAMRGLFDSQYKLTLTESKEKVPKSKTSSKSSSNSKKPTEAEKEKKILNVVLSVTPLENVVSARMNSEQKKMCELLMATKGCRQYVGNVFGNTNWLSKVTSYCGYRVNPQNDQKENHKGIDIGMPTGTEIHAGHDGTVTTAGTNGGYGLCVVIKGKTPEGKTLVTKYGHCSKILVSVGDTVKSGDVIAKVGSTGDSTGPHLHLEVIVNGNNLNPILFAETGDLTERHLPDVSSGGGSYSHYSVPPEALSDQRFRAILTEAEKYLGYPYVWGGSSPETSFDCSGYVSWVLNHSGWNVGRQGVTGLVALCTKVSPSEAKPGDLVFFERTYDVVGPSHVGIYVGNGMMIHCGDPISYTSINTSYWQDHFLHFGRLP